MKPLALALCLGLICAAPGWADEVKQDADAASPKEKLKADPNDATALLAYVSENIRELLALTSKDPDQAERKLKEVSEFLDSLEPDHDVAKATLVRARSSLRAIKSRIEIARVPLDELKKKLEESPDDAAALNQYMQKLSQELQPILRSKPDEAEKTVAQARKFLEGVKAKAEEDSTRRTIDRQLQSFQAIESSIETAKKHAALVGKEAAPLQVEAWVNGSPLTDDDLKGKVVLLDFWAVWCGPCIATFPHLREWHEKYADRGLVIIGLTRYYNYQWNEEAERAARSQDKVTAEDEHTMLQRFAEHHNLKHRFAVQTDSTLSDYYGVRGIPHVVIIDREGVIRLIRVGSGEQTAKDINEMLESLFEL